ncbi:MAG TPA: hypothetical protein VNJ08_10260 [Bacteriovoracaceae bacterium]|nr:hypothetical protein [Bacteriovoracaceae bacterium]
MKFKYIVMTWATLAMFGPIKSEAGIDFTCGKYRMPAMLHMKDTGYTEENGKLVQKIFGPRLVVLEGSLSEVSFAAHIDLAILRNKGVDPETLLVPGVFEVDLSKGPQQDSLEAKILAFHPLETSAQLTNAGEVKSLVLRICPR